MMNNKHIKQPNWEMTAGELYNSNKLPEQDDFTIPEGLSEEEIADRNEVRQVSRQIDIYFQQKKYSENRAWEKVRREIYRRKIRLLPLQKLFRVAAILVFVLLAGFSAYRYLYIEKELVTQNEIISSFLLPDGSRVSLNSSSKLFYPKKFSGKTREVRIEGEAFFEVKPNKLKPFIIHAGNMQIEVVGTSFNVNAYPCSDKIEVIVESGKVLVDRKDSKTTVLNELILVSGDKATLLRESSTLTKSANIDENFLAWKTHSLVFRQTSLKEVITQLEKVYKVDILLEDDKLNDLLLTAQYDNHSIDFIMEVISSTHKLDVELKDNRYFLRSHQ